MKARVAVDVRCTAPFLLAAAARLQLLQQVQLQLVDRPAATLQVCLELPRCKPSCYVICLQELLAASKVASGNTLLAADGTPYTEGRRSQDKRRNITEVRRTTSAGLPLAQASSEVAAVHSDSADLPSAHHVPALADGKGLTDLASIDNTWAQPGAKFDLHNEATNSKDTCWPQWLPFRVSYLETTARKIFGSFNGLSTSMRCL